MGAQICRTYISNRTYFQACGHFWLSSVQRLQKVADEKDDRRLENVAINDVLPLKAARRHAIANLKCFGASDTRDLISMVTFAFTMRRYLIRLASVPFISSRLATFGWVRFPCATSEKHNAEFTKGG